ncbi:MAG TPA: outer membrane protein transport protein [Cellvibrionaceae bacterium]
MKKTLFSPAALALLTMPSLAFAASFQLLEQSPAQMGKAFAGTASDITDASTVYFNPAGMSRLEGGHFTFGVNVVSPKAEFNDQGSTYPGDPGKTDEYGVIPNVYLVIPLADSFRIGFGAGGPFGLASDFGTTWQGRYSATFSELEVANFNVTTSWAPSDYIALGLGVNYQRIETTLENQVDSTFGISPDPSTDSSAKVQGDDDGFVLDVSLLITPSDRTSIGLLWREGGEFTLDGDASFELNAACAPGAGFPTGMPPAPTTGTLCAGGLSALAGDVEASVKLPDVITLSATHWFHPVWAIHVDVSQTRWSSIDEIDVINTGNDMLVDKLDLQYSDTMRYSLGTSIRASQALTWRAGIAFDEAPQTDPEFATARIPDADRTWIAFGANVVLSDALTMDVSYAHLLVDEASIHETDANSGRVLSGEFDSDVNIVAAQINWRF